jgi:hypothetical protein
MSEFKFSCPQCKQQVATDTSYAGARIDCPICQKSIVIPAPNAPSNERVVQIKVSTLKQVAVFALMAIVVAALAWAALYFLGGNKTVKFRAYVDGTDVVKLSGNQLWVEHLSWQQPNKMSVNDAAWTPMWNETESPNFPSWNDNKTAPYTLKRAFHQSNPDKIKLVKNVGRGNVSIIQTPSAANNNTLAIKLDDGPQGGADWYEFTVSW